MLTADIQKTAKGLQYLTVSGKIILHLPCASEKLLAFMAWLDGNMQVTAPAEKQASVFQHAGGHAMLLQ
jgi:hypothetical protein